MRTILYLAAGLLALAACTGAPTATPSPSPTILPSLSPGPSGSPGPSPTISPAPTPSPTPTVVPPIPTPTPVAGELSPAQVRYLLIDQLGPLHFCDPDEYPISRGDEDQKANAQFPIIQADAPTFTAITERIGMAGQTEFSAADKLAIYREWKALNGVDAQPLGNGAYQFEITTEGDAASGRALHILGTVDATNGQVSIASQEEVFGTSCPICLARGTLIDTPAGAIPVEQLQPGDPIWTTDAAGNRISSTVARIGSVPVPSSHQVVHLVLDDGRSLFVSPGHPLTDGRHAGDLKAGDTLDGATVVTADLTDYDGGRTFDVLPAGDTGFYWANGILIASTLR